MISKTEKIEKLSSALIRSMFDLFSRYYESIDFERFKKDLSEKTHVFLFFTKDKELIGFSTIFRKVLPEISQGIFLFSGDTVIDHRYWGNKMLQKEFFWFIVKSKLQTPFAPLYWMLISKGHKTYLMMRKNFQQSFPNYQNKTPEKYRTVQNSFYKSKFVDCYNVESNLIIFPKNLGAVKESLAFPSEEQKKDPDVDYFLKKNPQFMNGHELACVCEITFSDFLMHIPKFFLPILKKKKS